MMNYLGGFVLSVCAAQAHITVEPDLAKKIGDAIWQNECRGRESGLTHWKSGEEFPSFGIGHFIWYPSGVQKTFKETFPDLITFIAHHRSVPDWLKMQIKEGALWSSQKQFVKEKSSKQMKELRTLLTSTVDLQLLFIIQRLQDALPMMIKNLLVQQRALVHNRFVRLAQTPRGIYALADYVNFKGEGTASNEVYNGTRWGLLQVLLGMDDTKELIDAFVESAGNVLKQRVKASPKERNEQQWLKGWLNRIQTYKTIRL